MANDPHRVIEAPSLRYWVHLVAPGWNVIGGGEPVLPGVSIGHNEFGAWGLTIFGIRQRGPVRLRDQPGQPERVPLPGPLGGDARRRRHDSGEGPGRREGRAEVHAARAGAARRPRQPTRLCAAGGVDGERRRAVPGQPADEPGPHAGTSSARPAATTACPPRTWCGSTRKGTIGWQAAGIAPLRSWSGLLPVPGDGRFEWDGYLPITALPNEVNPARGFIATANHYLFPNDYAFDAARHWTWADPYRARRIEEVLGSGKRFSVAEVATAAERRPVDAGAGAGAAAARSAVQQPGGGQVRATCC